MTPHDFNGYPRLSTLMNRGEEAPSSPTPTPSPEPIRYAPTGSAISTLPPPGSASAPEVPHSSTDYAAFEALDTGHELVALPELPSNSGYELPLVKSSSPWALIADESSERRESNEAVLPIHSAPRPTMSAAQAHLELLESAPLHVVIREALRAKAIDMASAPRRHSAYELVFIMLAFAVMVLLVTPPMVDIFLAANGQRP